MLHGLATVRVPSITRSQLRRAAVFTALAVIALGCSTSNNPAFCCLDAADCAKHGVTDGPRTCPADTTCVGNTCVRGTCATDGCTAAAPVCDTGTGACGTCASADDCAGYPDEPVCDTTTGACRACALDVDCPSGACGDDGRCVDEARIVYLAPTGTDAPPCSKDAPCVGLQFGIQQTSPSRDHIVLAAGDYEAFYITIKSNYTSAPELWFHGGGARITGGSDDGFVYIALRTTFRDLELVSQSSSGDTLRIRDTTTLERVRVSGPTGLDSLATARLRDVEIRARDLGIYNGGSLIVERGRVIGGLVGVRSMGGTFDVNNLLVADVTGVALDLEQATGTIAFTTIAGSGLDGASPSLRCELSSVTIRSSIIWMTSNPRRVALEGNCQLASSIVGPEVASGAPNADPLFVAPNEGDYHLQPGSPARDAVDVGPAHDFEGDPRPRGLRFDLGADEAP